MGYSRKLCLLFSIVQDDCIFGSNCEQRTIGREFYTANSPEKNEIVMSSKGNIFPRSAQGDPPTMGINGAELYVHLAGYI